MAEVYNDTVTINYMVEVYNDTVTINCNEV